MSRQVTYAPLNRESVRSKRRRVQRARSQSAGLTPASILLTGILAVALACLLFAMIIPRISRAATQTDKVSQPAVLRYVVEENADEAWHSVADYAQGENIPFMLVGSLPENVASLGTFPFWLIAEPAEGLTYIEGSACVYLAHANGSQEDVTQRLAVGIEGTAIVAGSANLTRSLPALSATDTLVLTYAARFNDAVNYGFEQGNVSYGHLEYGSGGGSYQATPAAALFTQTAPRTAVTGHAEGLARSPEVPATVYTYILELRKMSESGTPLAGARFALRDANGLWYVRGEDWSANASAATVYTADAAGMLAFYGVDSETYELVEREAPKGYAVVDPINVTIESGIVAEALSLSARSKAANVLSVNAAKGIVRLGITDPKASDDPNADPGTNPNKPGGDSGNSGANQGGSSATPARPLFPGISTITSLVSGALPKTGDLTRSAWPLLLISVLVLLCALAVRRGLRRRNTHTRPDVA